MPVGEMTHDLLQETHRCDPVTRCVQLPAFQQTHRNFRPPTGIVLVVLDPVMSVLRRADGGAVMLLVLHEVVTPRKKTACTVFFIYINLPGNCKGMN